MIKPSEVPVPRVFIDASSLIELLHGEMSTPGGQLTHRIAATCQLVTSQIVVHEVASLGVGVEDSAFYRRLEVLPLRESVSSRLRDLLRTEQRGLTPLDAYVLEAFGECDYFMTRDSLLLQAASSLGSALATGDMLDEVARERSRAAVVETIAQCSRELVRHIANNPRSLQDIEWRDLERAMAEVFRGIGFDVELTPPSKDQGRDIILQTRFAGHNLRYLVELKHWRSGKHVGPTPVSEFIAVVIRE